MIFLIFPTQLFTDVSHLKKAKKIYLIEEPRYFTDFKFHKLKLAYHRATMKKYYDKLKKKFKITYINYNEVDKFYKTLEGDITYMDTADLVLNAKLDKLKIKQIDTINFLISPSEFETIKSLIFKKRYSHKEFYKYQKAKLSILEGEKSYDSENRSPLDHVIPKLPKFKSNKYIKEAIIYVEENFSDNYGSLDNFIFPIDNKTSVKWLNEFLEKRLNKFGKYEDAVSKDLFIYHSAISPMMNVGLLTDSEVVAIASNYYKNNKVKIESYEGFMRQVIGWRNYTYLIYRLERNNLFESNLLNHKNKLTEKWWVSNDIPVIDFMINKVVNYAYLHHIERLMYLGNFMLLCKVHPKEVYRIFMEWTIDAYDWVMVPNVFGMSQYASDIMTTRPYFSSSNYIIKMCNFVKKGDWCIIWDSLYYSFINENIELFKKNYAISQQVNNWMKKENKKEIIKIANKYIKLNYR